MGWEPVDPDDALPKGPRGETVGQRIKRLAAELHGVCEHHGVTCAQWAPDQECVCRCPVCRASR